MGAHVCERIGIANRRVSVNQEPLVLTSSEEFRRFFSGSLALTSLDLTCWDHRPDFYAARQTMWSGTFFPGIHSEW